jgi:hypothetical protein
MSRISVWTVFVALVSMSIATPARMLRADCLGCLEALNPFGGTPVDVHSPAACDNCGHEGCVVRKKVEDCVCGKEKLYRTSIHKEYVAIPEIRYRWKVKCVTKEIPCDFCKPVCKSEDVDHQYQIEHWEKQDLPCGGELYCKSCETKTEKLPVVNGCNTEAGKTTIKVHYLSCVKEPYTVYRQVVKEVGVRQPCYERVEVPVTRHVCGCCGGSGCESCQQYSGFPSSASGGEPSSDELPAPDQPTQH